jgi:circadian clock protein KaiC
MRDSSFESEIREFMITEKGLVISNTFESAEALLTGHPRITHQITPVFETKAKKKTPKAITKKKPLLKARKK